MGGTKIEILVINDIGEQVLSKRIATPKHNYDAIISELATLVLNAEKEVNNKCTVGICAPGSLSPATGLLRNSNTVCLNQKPFKHDIEEAIDREIRITNDANCFVLSEAVDGAAQDANIVFGVIVGTGVGGGIVINKKVLTGVNDIAGEWGHNPLPWPELNEFGLTKCWCGKQGCIETFLSGPGLENEFERTTGKTLTAEKILVLASEGNSKAEDVLMCYEHRMAKSLAHIINVLDPNVIVLGGGLSKLNRLYTNVPNLWQQWVFSDCVCTKLLPPKYGDSSGVRGAAWLWN